MNQKGKGPDWMFDLDILTPSLNYIPVRKENQVDTVVKQSNLVDFEDDQQFIVHGSSSIGNNAVSGAIPNDAQNKDFDESTIVKEVPVKEFENLILQETIAHSHMEIQGIASEKRQEKGKEIYDLSESDDDLPKDGIFHGNSFDDENKDTEEEIDLDLNNMDNTIDTCVLPDGKRVIGTKWVFRNKRDERGTIIRNKARLVAQGYRQEEGVDYDEVFAPVARIEAIRLFLAFASFMGFSVYQMDVKSAFLYGNITEEVYVNQPPGFIDPHHPNKVYKVIKALYGLHQAPRAWYARLSTFLLKHSYRRGAIDKTLFIKRDRKDIMLVQVYVDDIIFGSTKTSMVKEFEELMQKEFMMSSMGELTFFLGLQVKQSTAGIFISQDKYVKDILNKFDFRTIKPATTPIEAHKALGKDEEGEDIDVHLYRSMIGYLMYLTASRPDIMFAVCLCARFQVTPKISHLNAVKRIFRYLKHQPKLGLWYPKDSPFYLEAFSDSDYAGDNHDRRSTSGRCQYLGRRLVSWQCKKQTIVAISSTEAEYVAAASCCGQVLWMQNQLFDYGFNFMNTDIHIDNESTICIVKNPVFHSKTKHIQIRHHFIRDCYDQRLINVVKRNADFHDVIDFLTGCCVNYALLVSPDVIQQFWSTAKVCMINDVAHIAAKVAGQKILVSEASVRTDLLFHDEDGTNCFDNQVIWDTLRDIGYEGSLTLLSFSKPLFSPQWKYLVHTLLHSLSSKSSSWDQFGTNIASALVGLATNQKFNFSKLIFDGMLRNLKDSKPFLMYPRFIQLFLNKQLEGITKPQNFLPTVVLPSKVFTFMSKSSPKFSGKLTPLTPHMLEVTNAVRAEHSLHTEELDIPTSSHHSDDSSAGEKEESSSPVTSERPTSPNDYTPTDEVQTSGGDEGTLDLYGLTREVLRLKKQNTKQAAQILRLKTKIKILVKQVKPLIAEYRSFVKTNATLSKKKKLKKAHKKKSSSFKQGRKKVLDESTGLNEVDGNSGDSQVNEGTAEVFEGTAEVFEGTEEVYEGTEEVYEGTEEVHEGTAQVQESTAKVHESTAEVNEGTAEVNEGTAEVIEGTAKVNEGTDEGNESTTGANLRTEPSMKEVEDEAGPSTFQDESDEFIQDDTLIADLLVNISKNRRGAGITIPGNIPEQERPKSPTLILDPKDKGKGIMKEEPKKKKLTLQQLRAAETANDEEFARRVTAEWEEEEERKRLVGLERLQAELEDNEMIAAEVQRTERENFTEEQKAKFLVETIAAQRRFRAEQQAALRRSKPPTIPQLRNQMMKYIRNVGGKAYRNLKNKSYEEIKDIYEKVKRFNDKFVAIGSTEDEQAIKEMNVKAEEPSKKRKGTIRKMKSSRIIKKRKIQKSDDELKDFLKVVDFEGDSAQDVEVMEQRSLISRFSIVQSPEGEYIAVQRVNGHIRAFNTLNEVLHILNRQDLHHLHRLVVEYYEHIPPTGLGLILHGDLTTMMETTEESDDELWRNQTEWEIIRWRLYESTGVHILELENGTMIHMLVEQRYPLTRELMQRMLEHKLEVQKETENALNVIRFVMKQKEDLEREEE
ncbi:putative ribonuclease H-like domain-containing protein [Tanacetum coccineum]